MLRIHQLSLSPSQMHTANERTYIFLCAEKLGVKPSAIRSAVLRKRSLDARGRQGVCYRLTVDANLVSEKQEKDLAAKFPANQVTWMAVSPEENSVFQMKLPPWRGKKRPVVVGMGPAGLFCAAALAMRGANPILLERGAPVEERTQDLAALEENGVLQPESNVLFGEGGAGAFSDGKLTCGISDPMIRTVLKTLAECGAPEDILVAQRPHVGTDVLRKVLVHLREQLIALGVDIRFHAKLTDIVIRENHVAAVRFQQNGRVEEIETDTLCLCIGHSARDTYERLHQIGVPMQQKPFAIGVRIEHLQEWINRSQYKTKALSDLPPADYKLNVPTRDERGVYTFCMCPGGQVINASSELAGVNVNGMSKHARDGLNANAAVLVGVRPEDFGGTDPLAGVEFQRKIEHAAFSLTHSMKAPCQRVEDFLKRRVTRSFGEVLPTYRPGIVEAKLDEVLPGSITDNLRDALPRLGQRLRGFDHPDALLTGPETRSSAPLRILRNDERESMVGGLFPLGEGAGYAGGIVSAAVDGLNAGSSICRE